MKEFENYIKELQSEHIDNITEHSKRSALELLIKSTAKTVNEKTKVLHEPRRKENYGAPDFLIYIDSSIIGYIENKKITENLDKTIKSEQIKKYRELSDNILLTNYIEFVWIKKDVIERETLCYQSDLENKRFKPDIIKIQKVNELIIKFLSQAPIGIATTKDLALALAVRSRQLKNYLFDELERQEKEEHLGRLFGLFQTFKDNVSNDLVLKEFADAFAQMLVYGLFLAKLNADTKEVNLRNAEEFIPQSFQLIRELVSFFDELEKENYKETRWIIEETISIMNNLQLREIQNSLSFNNKQSGIQHLNSFNADPYIYFYEDFLAAYDSKLRKSKGVYYTPPQVVFFIVSSINQILVDEFKISKGLAGHDKVTALDFATGTGTFLTEIFKQVLNNINENRKAGKKLIIRDHLLKNIYGFEYLIAPYTITHLKLSQLLKDNDYELKAKERLQVYLTNTLEPAYAKQNLFLPGLTDEGELAKKVKENPVFDRAFINSKGYTYLFPLYIYISNGNTDTNGNGFLFKEDTKRNNFTPEFRKFIKTKYAAKPENNNDEIELLKDELKNDKKTIEETRTIMELQTNEGQKRLFEEVIVNLNNAISEKQKRLTELKDLQVSKGLSTEPEQVLSYIYAILHSPTYRKKYAEFLKFDFPRIPFVEGLTEFHTLSNLGWQLIQVHLLNEIPQGKHYENIAEYIGEGENEVEKPEYKNEKLFINKGQYFNEIPKEVYDFKIGAYQVLFKYLKDRKGHKLSYNEIMDIEKISKALKFTILQMKLIDKETKNWI